MIDEENDGNGNDNSVFIGMLDVMTNLAVTGVVIAMIALSLINPPPKNKEEKKVPTSPVALFYQVEWAKGMPHDIDMYVRCETKISAGQTVTAIVSYKQLQHVWLRLSKDDQGRPTPENVEKIESISDISKVPPSTECILNVHLYNSHGGILPVLGKAVAINQKDHPLQEENIGEVFFSLEKPGQEITLIVARWDANGVFEKGRTEVYPHVGTTYLATTPPVERRAQ